ncbi:MAG: hypothetical protein J7L75_02055 [Thermoproteales archaeon]|nr:hypothetical protein [Thermoproteales archaeon]
MVGGGDGYLEAYWHGEGFTAELDSFKLKIAVRDLSPKLLRVLELSKKKMIAVKVDLAERQR